MGKRMEISRPVGVPQCGAWGGLNSRSEGGPGHILNVCLGIKLSVVGRCL